MTTDNNATLDIATLPLADGRFIAVPLLALAEVQQFAANDEQGEGLGILRWRGLELPISSLEEFCGLPSPSRARFVTVGIFRADQDGGDKFRALAFSGLAAYRRVSAEELVTLEPPAEGRFAASAEIEGVTFLIPDLGNLLFSGKTGRAA